MTPQPKSLQLSSELHQYIVAHGTPPDTIAEELIAETQRLGGVSRMQIAPEQGAFMTLLARSLAVRDAGDDAGVKVRNCGRGHSRSKSRGVGAMLCMQDEVHIQQVGSLLVG